MRDLHALPEAPSDDGIRIVLADDHRWTRRSLQLLLDREDDLRVIAEVETLPEVLDHLGDHLPHVLVLDCGLSHGWRILDTIGLIRREVPETQIVVLALDDDPVFASQALGVGAAGFVLKDRATDDLPAAVRSAAANERFVSPLVAAQVAALSDRGSDPLTGQELEILRLLALGYTSAESGEIMHLSPRTVETYRSRIHRKLGMSRRADLVAYALRAGLVDPELGRDDGSRAM